MTERDLEESLRVGYREIVDRSAPGTLRSSVSEIPDLVPAGRKAALMGRLLPFALIATAATVSLVVGIGLVISSLPNFGQPSGSSHLPTSEASIATTEPSEPSVVSPEFLSLLRFALIDYDGHDSPQDLRDDSDLVVVGRFVAVTEGREMQTRMGTHATFTVAVDMILAGSSDYIVGGQVFLELMTQARGAGDDLREVLPTGRVLFFLGDRSDVEGMIGPSGAPEGAPIFALASPMGLILEDGNGLVGLYFDLDGEAPAWTAHKNFDGFVAAIGSTGLTRAEAVEVANAEAPQTIDLELRVAKAGPLVEVWEDGTIQEWAQALPHDQPVWYLFFRDEDDGHGTIVVLDYESGAVYEVADLEP